MGAIDAIDERWPVLAKPLPCVNHIPVELRGMHTLRKQALMVIARDCLNAIQVGLRGTEYCEPRQIILINQIFGCSRDAQVIVILSEPPAPGRSAEAEEWNVGTIRHPPKHLLVQLVRL